MSKKQKMIICRNCNAAIEKHTKICPSCGAKNKKPFYKRAWFVLIIIILIIWAVGAIGGNSEDKFDWKEIALGEQLPEPKSNVGLVMSNDEDNLNVRVDKTSESDYDAYMASCQEMGYTVESEKENDNYSAFNEEGYWLELSCIGEAMYIELASPEEVAMRNADEVFVDETVVVPESETDDSEAQTTEPVETEESSNTTDLIEGMRPEFKQAMDSYEEFMNQYCDFMEKYAESDGTDVTMLTDYAEYMSKYTEMIEDFNAWNSEEMNAEETTYYIEVQTRVNEKLLEVAE